MRNLFAQMRLSLAIALQYRMDYFLAFFTVCVATVVEVALWRMVFKQRGQIQGFGLPELLVYVVIANIVNLLRVNWEVVMEMAEEVRSGAVARHLLKPISLYTVGTGRWLSAKIPILFGAVVVLFAIGYEWPLLFNPSLFHLVEFALFMTVSLWMSAEIYHLIVLSAFWIDDNQGVAIAFNILTWAFAGMSFPLQFYPKWMQYLLDATPFPYLVGYPVMSLLGRLPPSVFALKLACAVAFGAVFHFARKSVWHLAEERLLTVGG